MYENKASEERNVKEKIQEEAEFQGALVLHSSALCAGVDGLPLAWQKSIRKF